MNLLRTFRFAVQLRQSPQAEAGSIRTSPPDAAGSGTALADGGFQECSGLEIEIDVQKYEEGGRNDGIIQRLGRAKYQNIVLKRGMFYDKGQVSRDLWKWIQDAVSGVRPLTRYDGFVQVMATGEEDVVATWVFERGIPAKISGPQLNGKTGEIAIEELHIAHEGLSLVES